MRVVVAAGVAADLRAFDSGGVRTEIEIVHRHENAALRRLETVTDVRQRAANNDGHRVGEIAVLKFVRDVQGGVIAVRRGGAFIRRKVIRGERVGQR